MRESDRDSDKNSHFFLYQFSLLNEKGIHGFDMQKDSISKAMVSRS